ncbi:MAG TPA: ferredoxin-thioredoxin reductase catalytic domain-containing protein [Spirochaetota bacterium]|nr:ferredoxin-thioredoxin reductase catalytic domain-containing protein [Spirochaetota bacterium]HPS87373.1 ferredoxin-thioredoxin reductase catalytic domain-containing protein [Spirochaetota bacterium]
MKPKSYDDVSLFISMVADKNKWKLNRDSEHMEMITEGLMKNYNRYGYFSCPCRDAEGVREKDKDMICPCDYCVPDQKEFGHCYCGLYLTEEFYKSGKEPKSIPERRKS